MVLAVVVTAAAACTGTGDDEPAATMEPTLLDPAVTHTTPAPAPATTPTDDEAAIIAAVHGYWDAVLAANSPPDPDHPALARYATGPALETSRRNATERRQLGQSVRLPPETRSEHRVTIGSVSAEVATVRDCGVDDAVLHDLSTGRVLNDAVETTDWELTLRKVDGSWRVAEARVMATWDGVTTCGG